ncbi:MAG: hypothetical protein HQK60_07895 [Deltaproteobacteria bacterium]|nr:hypothetical protein [Deltaproteobacteria bacterium]
MEYFDTLSVYDRLAKAGLPDAASRVLSEVFKDYTQQQLELLATKKDIAEVKRDIAEVKGSVDALRLITQRDIEELRLTTQKDIEGLRLTTQRDISDIKRDIEELRLATQKDIEISRLSIEAKLQETISKSQFELMKEIAGVKKWAIGLIIAQMVLISALKLFS